MSFFSVHGYYDDDFILESGSFDTKYEAQDLCDILNNSNNSEHLSYVIVESKTLTEPTPSVSISSPPATHIFFDDYDLVTDYYLDNPPSLETELSESRDDNFSNETEMDSSYYNLENIVIKRYGVGYVFEWDDNTDNEELNDFIKENTHLDIHYLRHCDRYFFRKCVLEDVLEVYDFEVNEEKIPFQQKIFSKHWTAGKLTVDTNTKQIYCDDNYKYRHDYYFLGAFSDGPNIWTFKPKAFKKFMKNYTLLIGE